MKRLVGVFVMVAMCGMSFGQLKIGHVDPAKVLEDMPDYKDMMETLQEKTIAAQKVVVGLDSLYRQKLVELQNLPADASDTKKLTITKDIQNLEQRIPTVQQQKEQELQSLQADLMANITKKFQDAVKVVADKGSYNYILDASAMHYMNGGNDVTNEVRLQLGLTSLSE